MEFISSISAQQHLLPPVIFLAMLAVGMELNVAQFRVLFAQPGTPLKGTVIHTITFPALAVGAILMVQFFGFEPSAATVIGVLLIAACPSGGFSNILTMMARANLPLSIVLTAVSSILSFATVPLLLGGFGFLVAELSGPVALPVGTILGQLGLLVLLPVVLGMWMRAQFSWATAKRIGSLQNGSQLLLYLTVGLMIVENWAVMSNGFLTALPWSAGLCFANIGICFFASRLARLNTEDAITVALEGSIRNLGIAFLIAANTLGRMDIAVFPTVYFLSVLVFAILFAKTWRRLPGFKQSA
ncbi:MAG: bile acid:sodium symporter [Pseudomonadales bacterium]